MANITQGQCLCGDVRVEGKGTPHLAVCHCGQCRRWTGGIGVGVTFDDGLALQGASGLTWFQSSEWAERGFCSKCGSSMLYRLTADPETYYPQAGVFDLPSGLQIEEHIFCDAKPDYYDFSDDAPRLSEAETLAKFQSAEGQ